MHHATDGVRSHTARLAVPAVLCSQLSAVEIPLHLEILAMHAGWALIVKMTNAYSRIILPLPLVECRFLRGARKVLGSRRPHLLHDLQNLAPSRRSVAPHPIEIGD
jgi:hypothetical protein